MSNLTLLLLVTCLPVLQTYRILFIPAHSVPSHTKSLYKVAEILKNAGHDVLVLQLVEDIQTGAASNQLGIPDRVISLSENSNNDENAFAFLGRMPWTKRASVSYLFYSAWKVNADICIRILSNRKTRTEFESVMNEKWDAIIIDNFTPVCSLLVFQIHPKPVLIDFATMPLLKRSIDSKGILSPTLIGAVFDEPQFDSTKFTHRLNAYLHNLEVDVTTAFLDLIVPFWVRSVGWEIAGLSTIHDGSSLAITSVPNGLDFTQPRSRDLGEFDNACSMDTTLSDPFSTFVNHPTSRGTVLFAMGHFLDWKYAPAQAIAAFVHAFARFPQYRIVWQFNAPKPDNLSANVLLHSWIPQTAILSHPKTKVFISHMGYKSMREAICARVPVLAVPMFGDQDRNTAAATHRGFAVYIDKYNLTEESVFEGIKMILDEEEYSTAVRRLKEQMEDKIRNQSILFNFQLEFFIRRNEERILNKYIKNKWNKLPFISRLWNADIAAPCVFLIAVICTHFL